MAEVSILRAEQIGDSARHRICGGEVVRFELEYHCRVCGQFSRSIEMMSNASGFTPRRVTVRPGQRGPGTPSD